ncbi:MAG: tRNA (adenosine(37)-N6)-dimethylallyltransferase MiaA [Alphaproteobacteria bacterium]|nr:tRNA (adenosine(37)-N6)-dimethylallyltransferase MiaA [Alphaproteobacteria bacterium]
MKLKKMIVIGGPTASGKTSLSIQIAKDVHGQVVNADAIQVYKDLQILSARPSEEEQAKIPHYLFGYMDAWTKSSVQDWLQKVSEVLPELTAPVFVGGTGFYLDALVNGLSPIPDVPTEIREKVRAMSLDEVKALVKEAQFSDPQRLRRALEIQLSTGKSLIYFQNLPKKHLVQGDFQVIYLLPPREQVYAQCEKRLITMLQAGMIEEVQHLRDIQATGGVMHAIGVPEVCRMLDGEITKKEMMQQILLSTRHYAKRQMTWFRHQGNPDVILKNPKMPIK